MFVFVFVFGLGVWVLDHGKYGGLPFGGKCNEVRSLAYYKYNKAPCVTVRVRVMFADVRWVHERGSPSVDLILERYSQELRESAEIIFRSYSGVFSSCNIYGDLVSYNNLIIKNARCAAIELYDLLCEISARG